MSDTPNPSIPAVADLFTPKQRVIIYLLSVLVSAAYPIVELNTDLHWGVMAGYAAWGAFVGLVAVSNTPRTASGNDRGQAGTGLIWTVAGILIVVALCIWIARAI